MEVIQEDERIEIERRYEEIFDYCEHSRREENRKLVRKAFDIAYEMHKGMRRKSGEPYIYHPIAVARICGEEIGLGTKSVICSLLHDVVEDTDFTLESIEKIFGPKITQIIDGLTKISGIFDENSSLQAENFRRMLLTLSEDVRVILIKLADRLHNMRTLGSMPEHKQLKIAAETLFLYAPLAHRLGLYAIKTELEDLSFKYKEPVVYNEIYKKLKETEEEREKYIDIFCQPIKAKLNELNIKYTIKGRAKSIYSIWTKMQKKNVPFEEVYDIFAVRIVFEPFQDLPEKNQCWFLYAIITDYYQPNPSRLRDWVSTPKANGYEALHTTVMGQQGKWVEVQIRSSRMDEIAERGYAAHWKYKDLSTDESQLELWIKNLRDILDTPNSSAIEFLDNFKMNLFSSEIYSFTPKGLLKRLPQGATALDFAFDIHSAIGYKAIGAKINHRLEPLSYVLRSGDQVEILTSDKQTPQREWIDFVVTANAKAKLQDAFKSEKRESIKLGQAMLEEKLNKFKLLPNTELFQKLFSAYVVSTKDELYAKIGNYMISLDNFENVIKTKRKNKIVTIWDISLGKTTSLLGRGKDKRRIELAEMKKEGKKKNALLLSENPDAPNYSLGKCCNPIPGDKVMGFVDSNKSIVIHKTTCQTAIKLMSSYGDRILSAKWTVHRVQSFLTHIKVNGIDRIGIVNDITRIISEELSVNMRSIYFDSLNGVFEGNIDLYVHNLSDLEHLMSKLKKIKSVNSVVRVDNV
ncbi:MAG: GTP pyrophosphokinase [Bacteroidetes bacterium RIFOXYA12_FULL_35_11]|nr:MAG: GTP pyrophosphokinase [Bacteroidetes bacterium GWF2_35_48]OFY79303.1 MAG: GTP pyrophosphokinase [Bacteroidetes bacterium RIFOXYA12_FULL_35_11]HBX51947.1 GTP pyrophosphokinase [Bacteroidales bacterium]